jgi:hypothetical protein
MSTAALLFKLEIATYCSPTLLTEMGGMLKRHPASVLGPGQTPAAE